MGMQADSSMAAWWGRQFDRIYCFHHTGMKGRYEAMHAELERVGILGSGVFQWVITSPDPHEATVLDSFPKEDWPFESRKASLGFINLGMATARAIRESLYFGHRRILVLEDDLRFLNDLGRVRDIIDATPDAADAVQYDKYLMWGEEDDSYAQMAEERPLGYSGRFFDPGDAVVPSGACLALNRNAMTGLLMALELGIPRPVDGLLQQCRLRRAVAVENAGVQIYYRDSLQEAYTAGDKELRHYKAYELMGVDLSRYAVPEGYIARGEA